MSNSDGTVDAEYTFGRDVETYVSPEVHARLLVFKSRRDDNQRWQDSAELSFRDNEHSANF